MTLPRKRITDDRELEQETGIKPADHDFSNATINSPALRKLERQLLGPSWGKKRAPYRGRR